MILAVIVRQEIFVQLIRLMKFQSDFAICCNQKRQVEKGGDAFVEVCSLRMGVSSGTRRCTVTPLFGVAAELRTFKPLVRSHNLDVQRCGCTPLCVAFTILTTGSAIPRLRLCIRVHFTPVFANIRRMLRS